MLKTLDFNLNKFLKTIRMKKQYLQSLKKQLIFLNNIKQKNYKLVNCQLSKNVGTKPLNGNIVIMYVLAITFSRSNTFFHLMDFSGKLKYSCSAGQLKYKGKSKLNRLEVLKSIYLILAKKLKFLKGKPIALHLNNVGSRYYKIIVKLKKKFYIKIIKIFDRFPFNGCRKKKVRRIKKMKKWLSGLKRQTVNLLSYSHRRFKSFFLQYLFLSFSECNAVGSVPVLGTGSHVFKSHHFENYLCFMFVNPNLKNVKLFLS